MESKKVIDKQLEEFHKKLIDVSDMLFSLDVSSDEDIQEILNIGENIFSKVLSRYKKALDHIPGINDFLSFEVDKSNEPEKMHFLSHILGGKFIKSGDKGFSRENCRKLVDHIDYMNKVFKDTLFFLSDQTQIKVTRIWQKKESTPATWCIG